MNEPRPPRSARLPLTAILIVAFAAGLGLWAGQRFMGGSQGATPALANGVLFPQPRTLPAFALDGADGKTIDVQALAGRWTVVFLGFTHCPDICPTTLAQLAQAEKALADLPAGKQPRILFVSADPERDTPKATADYARYFSPNAIGATADLARLEPFARSLGMIFVKTDLGNGDYTIDHSSSLALLDPNGAYAGVIRPPLDSAKIAADLRLLATR
jgi:protein SCO1